MISEDSQDVPVRASLLNLRSAPPGVRPVVDLAAGGGVPVVITARWGTSRGVVARPLAARGHLLRAGRVFCSWQDATFGSGTGWVSELDVTEADRG